MRLTYWICAESAVQRFHSAAAIAILSQSMPNPKCKRMRESHGKRFRGIVRQTQSTVAKQSRGRLNDVNMAIMQVPCRSNQKPICWHALSESKRLNNHQPRHGPIAVCSCEGMHGNDISGTARTYTSYDHIQ